MAIQPVPGQPVPGQPVPGQPGLTQPVPEPKRHWLRILFVLPFIAMLWVSSYNRLEPSLFGFPFYYWYQLLWVLVGAAIAGVIYKAEH